MLLAIALAWKCTLHQLDINNAFLHDKLLEEIYMELPQFYQSEKVEILKTRG